MHEVGIAEAILEAGQTEAARIAGARLVSIRVRVGKLSGVDMAALEFALDALRRGTDLETVSIELEAMPRLNACRACGHRFETEMYAENCPQCDAAGPMLVGGEELELTSVEVETP